MNRRRFLLTTAAGAAAVPLLGCGNGGPPPLLHASYDATRELYRDVNRLFAERTGQRVRMSHGGSGSQARAVIDGLPADVVSLALWPDLDAIRKAGLIEPDWENAFSHRSLPYTSTIVLVVRKGNPHGIRDWSDLTEKPVRIVAANPKTSGAAKLAVLAAWGAAKLDRWWTAHPDDFLRAVFSRVPSLESSSRSATVSFARKQIGDVHLTWENEAWLEVRESRGELEIIYPSRSIRAEPHVVVVDRNVTAVPGRAERAREYLQFLYDPAAQRLIAGHHFRPIDPGILAEPEVRDQFARLCDHPERRGPLREFTVTDLFPAGWDAAQDYFFADGKLFDQIFTGQ